MSEAKHTPKPWKVFNLTDIFTDTNKFGKGDVQICDCRVHQKILTTDRELPDGEAQANAAFICLACNNHDALVKALDKMLKQFIKYTTLNHDKCWEVIETRELLAQIKKEQGTEIIGNQMDFEAGKEK